MLREHGHAKTNEQTTKQAEKQHGGAVPCDTGWPCHVAASSAVRLAARVLSEGVFFLAARVSS